MSKTGGGNSVDYDQQFEEDLEKAQALSLETLALENFRMEKMKLELLRYHSTESDSANINDKERVRHTRELKRDRSVDSVKSTSSVEARSRPRPGSFNSGGPCAVRIKPPPPTGVRRNSVTINSTPSTPMLNNDLISFHSPTGTKDSHNDLDQLDLSMSVGNVNTFSTQRPFQPPGFSNVENISRDIGFDLTNLGSDISGISPLPSLNLGAPPPPGFYLPLSAPKPSFPPTYKASTHLGFNVSDLDQRKLSLPSTRLFNGNPQLKDGSSSQASLDVFKVVKKRDNSNLIDLTAFDIEPDSSQDKSVRVSVLEAFDPLLTGKDSDINQSKIYNENNVDMKDEVQSECSGSFYDAYDPFDYLNSPPSVAGSQTSDPIYAAVVKGTPLTPPPLPPRNGGSPHKYTPGKKGNRQSRLYDNVLVEKQRALHHDSDLVAFHSMVQSLREEFIYSDPYTNVGLVISPTIESTYHEGTSVKVLVYNHVKEQPVMFTCDVSSSVEHIVLHVVYELECGSAGDYVLKVWGLAEYLSSHTTLADYEYVHQCIKLEKDISLVLLHVDNLLRPLCRTIQDDNRDKMLTLDDLLPKEPVQPISFETMQILLETLEREMDRVETAALELSNTSSDASSMPPLQPRGVIQAVKAVCALLGNVETLDISHALDMFNRACSQFITQEESWARPEIVEEIGDYSVIRFQTKEGLVDSVRNTCERIRDAVQGLIETYSLAFRVDFRLIDATKLPYNKKLSSEVLDTVLLHVECLHRLSADWNHDEYLVAGQLYHGTRPVGHPVLSKTMAASQGLYNRVIFDCWLNFEGTSVCILPRECRLVLVIYGRSIAPAVEGQEEGQVNQVELGWTATQFFNYDGVLAQGSFLLSVWPPGADKRLGPAPAPGTQPHGDMHPVLGVELPDYGGQVMFPPLVKETETTSSAVFDFNSLDHNTQQQLLDITEQDTFTKPLVEDREVLWEKRHYLSTIPHALPKVFLAAHSWDYACLADLHSMLHTWTPMDPVNALQLLLPCFPDSEVRHKAVSWIRNLGSDELVDYLPQLVQALKHETFEASALARFLLERALTSPRVAHYLYWLLTQTLPGQSPQNSCEVANGDDSVCEARYYRRMQLMLRALLAISGEAPRQRFLSQQLLVKSLFEIAENVKSTKESLRLKSLISSLESLHGNIEATPTCLPLSPSLEVHGIQVRTCSYFPSNTLPLKINFNGGDNGIISAIFKVGDDLQQDMLTLQMIRIMDKLWLKEGLDLKMVTFACVPTGTKRGMIEMVTDAETLRKIQVELGLTGSFKDRPIAEWLAKHNSSALEYERAVSNFTASCAGYSVVTYVLGICDRHNDNIMLKTSGHLFHIDYGKFLGDAQMFGNFKRDRTPFVLTSDMAFVINGGDKPSARFQHFVDLCCEAFNIVRKHGNLLLNLFGLMASSGIPGVTMDAVRYVQRSLLLELSNAEAAATFARMIQSSLKSWFTQFNFFLHNLAQLRFTGDHNDGNLLSFVSRTYTMQQEGRLKSVEVYNFQKRYDTEKYYVYILKVERMNQTDPSYLFRSYKEFYEFQQKLCILFPLAKCYSLQNTSLHMGRSNIKQVAEKRKVDITRFLTSLFNMADEICHSDLVYTFFHPMLRDQKEASIHAAKLKEPKRDRSIIESNRVRGQIKLAVHYLRGTLMVMVHHVRQLPTVSSGQEPSTYVKVYLLPDPGKQTKRKTKVVRRSCHPSFMEMLEYRMPLEVVQNRTLQATVWNHDALQENEFLGGISLYLNTLDLTTETLQWYQLGNIHR
uniref:Uncharacterized protein n=3 Tax=Clastoptera arizonana TaxID=38151 RepID=A0A1B6CT28_9HEMI